jgi:hypothetical protein
MVLIAAKSDNPQAEVDSSMSAGLGLLCTMFNKSLLHAKKQSISLIRQNLKDELALFSKNFFILFLNHAMLMLCLFSSFQAVAGDS